MCDQVRDQIKKNGIVRNNMSTYFISTSRIELNTLYPTRPFPDMGIVSDPEGIANLAN